MRYPIFLAVSIVLVAFQTSVVPDLPLLLSIYDPVIPFILYMILFRPFVEALTCVLVCGGMLDALSGAPAGMYILTYFCLLLMFHKFKTIFQLPRGGLFQSALIFSVLFENLIFGGVNVPAEGVLPVFAQVTPLVLIQLFWAVITGRPVYRLLTRGFKLAGRLSLVRDKDRI